MNITPYEQGNRYNHDPVRSRKLLLHRKEIQRLIGAVEQQGLALIPLEVYFRDGRAKVTLALGRGKKQHDRREDLKRRIADREMARAVRGRGTDGDARSCSPPGWPWRRSPPLPPRSPSPPPGARPACWCGMTGRGPGAGGRPTRACAQCHAADLRSLGRDGRGPAVVPVSPRRALCCLPGRSACPWRAPPPSSGIPSSSPSSSWRKCCRGSSANGTGMTRTRPAWSRSGPPPVAGARSGAAAQRSAPGTRGHGGRGSRRDRPGQPRALLPQRRPREGRHPAGQSAAAAGAAAAAGITGPDDPDHAIRSSRSRTGARSVPRPATCS